MILITGASGFVGQHVIKRFLQAMNPNNIRIFLLEKEADFVKNYPGINVVFGDLTDKMKVRQAVKDIDTIIHLASKNIDRDNTGFKKINVEATRSLCDAAVCENVKKFIYLSSVGVYGHGVHKGIDENFHIKPDTSFSCSKAEAENIILSHNNSENFEGIVLRHRFVYGRGDGHVIARIVNAARKYRFLINGGKASMSFILVDDLAEVIFRFASQKVFGVEPIFHVTDGCPVTYRDIIFMICDAYGFKKPKMNIPFWFVYIPVKFYELIRNRDPETAKSSISSIRLKLIGLDNYFSNKKLMKTFGNLKFRSFKENFSELIDYYSQFQ